MIDIRNLSKQQKIIKLIEDVNNKVKSVTISSTIFPKNKISDEELIYFFDKITDDICYISLSPNSYFIDRSISCGTINAKTIEDLVESTIEKCKEDKSIIFYSIGFDLQLLRYSLRAFFFEDYDKEKIRLREEKINNLLNRKTH